MKLREKDRTESLPEEDWALPGPDDALTTEDRTVLSAAMSVLEDEEQRIVLLHAVTGLKHREIAESLNTVELYAYSSWGESVEANRIVPFGVRNVEISVSNGEKTELVNGENKIYVPYEILSKTPLSAAVCAAVVNKDGIQTDFDVVNLDNVIKYRDNVELTVNITDAKNDYVKVFAFDGTGTLVPLMDVKTIN